MSEKKSSINIYQVYDSELERMHRLLHTYISLPQDQIGYSKNPTYSNTTGQNHQLGTIYKRILEMQNVLIKSFAERDELIQEKVAELALTGLSDSE